MKEKTMPLYWFSYSKRYYLTHPWAWFKDLRIGIKNFWHRGRTGWAWVDLWNTDTYLGQLLPNMLEELAERSHGWPQSEEYPTFEDWQCELRVLAKLLNILNIDVLLEQDKFEDAFNEYRAGVPIYPLRNLNFYNEYVLTEDECKRIDEAPTKYERLAIEDEILRVKLFGRVGKIFRGLWD